MAKRDTKRINIMVVAHRPAFIADNPHLKSIQVGTSQTGKLEGMDYYDNTGDNISSKNKSYCELTAIYWTWKNLDSDYYGLFHYRRYLAFMNDDETDDYDGRAYPDIQSSLGKIRLEDKRMRSIIESYDLLLPRKGDTLTTSGDISSYEHYRNSHYIKDLDYCIKLIEQKYPEVAKYTHVLNDRKAYFANMFIMKKEIFGDYCSFLFDILEDFEKNNDFSDYNTQQSRVVGYLAERLSNIYFHYLIGLDRYKVKELQIAFFENTDPEVAIQPLKVDRPVNIVLAANDYYSPYLSTIIHSISHYSSLDRTYDINILHSGISQANQSMLIDEFTDNKNISIRFANLGSRMKELAGLGTQSHITIETYFRLFIPDIMKDYDKVLYLDGDMIVKRDVAELFDENIDGYMLGACRDIDMAGVCNSNNIKSEDTIDPARSKYIKEVVKLKNINDYFQAGVLLLNLKELREKFSVSGILKVATSREWVYQDQDILNFMARGKVKHIDMRWNMLYDWEFVRIRDVISKSPAWMYKQYMESRKDPFIIHYGGSVKPWQRADTDFAIDFWCFARKSVYYELILSRMSAWAVSTKLDSIRIEPSVRITTKMARRLRREADTYMPVGTIARKPITYVSRVIKKIIY